MKNLNVWEWLMIVTFVTIIVVPTIIQIYSYIKQTKIKGKWFIIFSIWGIGALLIVLFAVCWYLTSK